MRVTLSVCGLSLLIALTGCDLEQLAQPPAGATQRPTNVGAAAGVAVDGNDLAGSPAPAPPAPATQQVQAGVGVGQQGRSLDEYEGVYVTPVKALFATRERLVFEVQIPQALQLFNATEGRNPKSHEEFMEKIVKANQIQLPELPPNNRYIYDPKTNELMVELPKPKEKAP